jgi:hypothetical protein
MTRPGRGGRPGHACHPGHDLASANGMVGKAREAGFLNHTRVGSCILGSILAVVLVAMATVSGSAYAQVPQQVGLVVVFGDGQVETRCIPMDGNEMAGDAVLARSGLDTVVDPSSGMGVRVCRIEGVGCAFPSQHCFCQCMGGSDCAYWNYYYRDPGDAAWIYSPLGPGLRKVKPGAVEGWVWGDGHTPPSEELTFTAICVPPMVAPTETPELPTETPGLPTPAVTTVAAKPTEVAQVAESPSPVPSATIPAPTQVASPVPAASAGSSGSSYWLFGLMAVGLVAVGVLVWRRRL